MPPALPWAQAGQESCARRRSEAVGLAAIGGSACVCYRPRLELPSLALGIRSRATIPIDPRIGTAATLLGTTLLLSALVSFGLLPAWQMTRKSFAMASNTRVRSTVEPKQSWKPMVKPAARRPGEFLTAVALCRRALCANTAKPQPRGCRHGSRSMCSLFIWI